MVSNKVEKALLSTAVYYENMAATRFGPNQNFGFRELYGKASQQEHAK